MAIYAPTLTSYKRHVVMMKATADPNTDGNWASVDDAVKVPGLISAVSSWVHDSDVYVSTIDDTGRVALHVFDPGTDTWTTENELVSSNGNPANGTCFIRVRSDGDVIVLYDNSDGTTGVDYSRREGVSWTRDVQVDNGGSNGWAPAGIVLGLSDRMHFAISEKTVNDLFQRTLTSANVLEAFPSAIDTSIATGSAIDAIGVAYVSGGATKVRIPYKDSDNKVSIVEFDSADVPSPSTTTAVSDNTAGGGGGFSACLAADGTTVHLLYADSSTLDLFRDKNEDDGGWGTDVEELDGVTILGVCANAYDRSGQKLAFLYVDSATLKYGEVDIAGAPAGGPAVGSLALMGIGK